MNDAQFIDANENLTIDRDTLDLVTRLQQIEHESDLLASQRRGLQRLLRAAEMAHDGRRT